MRRERRFGPSGVPPFQCPRAGIEVYGEELSVVRASNSLIAFLPAI
jgi:hypothetical protein